MHRILIVSLYYPPINSIASNRIDSFSKYLDPEKFKITVITLLDNNALAYEEKDNITIYRLKNTSFFKRFSFQKKQHPLIHKLKAFWNISLSNITDAHSGWLKNATRFSLKLMQKQNFDLVLSSYAPLASHMVALSLKKNFPEIKWIADMRDEMSKNPFLSVTQRKKLFHSEKNIFLYTDAITSVSQPILEDFKILSNPINKKIKFLEIRNGYDFTPIIHKSNTSIFTISYVGSFYGAINPQNFLKALLTLKPHILKKIHVNFIGSTKPFKIPEKLLTQITIYPIVSHHEALDFMRESDALLIIHPTNGRKGVYTGKLFEYLGMLKPIIALMDTHDVAAKLINNSNTGYACDNNNIEKIASILTQAYQEYQTQQQRTYNLPLIQAHHRKEQTKRLEKLIDELLT